MSDGLSSVELIDDSQIDADFFRELESKGIKLNSGQIELVRHKDNPALANAVAGAGKSSSVVSRLSYLNRVHKIDLSKVLMITFTKKASEEMVSKATKIGMTSKEQLKKVSTGTFHSIFLKILRENGEQREILASDKSKQITIKMIFRDLKIDEKKYRPEDILSLISHYKNHMIGLNDYKESEDANREFYTIWSRYEKYKMEKYFIDFDDILLNTHQLLIEDQSILEGLRNKYHYIMVDEYQDTNAIQSRIVELIAHPKNNLLVVGDSDQAIFSFNGAKIENILNFTVKYNNAKIITLDTNYRSTNTILGLANHAIKKNKLRFDKQSLASKKSSIHPQLNEYESTDDEADKIVKYIKAEYEAGRKKLSDFAVLFRSNSNSRAIFEQLLLNDVPFTSYNSDDVFYVNGTVKPLLAYLRVAVDPYDFQAVGDLLPTLYVAKDEVKEIGKLQQKSPIANPIEHVLDVITSQYQRSKVSDKLRAIKKLTSYKPIIAIKMLRDDYEKYLIGEDDSESTSLHREIVKETLDELENSSKKFDDVAAYIAFIDRVIRNAKMQKEAKTKTNYDSVKIMTIHKSKGLEFNTVFGITLNESVLPHKSALEVCSDVVSSMNALEEEMRLFYVLVTRAEENLHLSYVEEHRGKPMAPSRFIQDYI
jgi:DNA helicase-2/ATP-dependent DNA helicase PcrA